MISCIHSVQIDVFADGVAIKEPGAECFRLLRQFLDGVLMVSFCTLSRVACAQKSTFCS